MLKRLLRWFVFNFLFALTPFATVIVIRTLANLLSLQTMQENLSEILFFTLMICVTSLGEISDTSINNEYDNYVEAFRWFFILGAVWSAILYGVFLFDLIVGANVQGFRFRLMWLSIIFAVVVFLSGILVQVFLGKLSTLDQDK